MKKPEIACVTCSRFNGLGESRILTCTAFPKGIPKIILDGDESHRDPFKGDNGYQWRPLLGFERFDTPERIHDYDILPMFKDDKKQKAR